MTVEGFAPPPPPPAETPPPAEHGHVELPHLDALIFAANRLLAIEARWHALEDLANDKTPETRGIITAKQRADAINELKDRIEVTIKTMYVALDATP